MTDIQLLMETSGSGGAEGLATFSGVKHAR